MRDIGKNIKALREKNAMTQDELAEKLFVTRQTVSNYEIGRSRPDIEMLEKIAQILGTDVNAVLYGIPTPADRKRRVIGFCIAALAVVLLFAARVFLSEFAEDFAEHNYDLKPTLWVVTVLDPALCFLCGWTLLHGLGVFAKLVPISFSGAKWVRLTVILIAVLYLLIMLPSLLEGGWADIPEPWLTTALFLMGVLHGFNYIRWNLLLFSVLGGVFWLFPWHKR